MLQAEKKPSRIASRTDTAIAAALFITILLIVAAPLGAWGARSLIDAPAPDFALKNLDGENLRLSEYRGEVVLINFWSTTCGRRGRPWKKRPERFARPDPRPSWFSERLEPRALGSEPAP